MLSPEQDLEQRRKINDLEEEVRGLKDNEERLLADLVKQQQTTKETLLTLKSITAKYETEKEQLGESYKKQKQDAIQHERDKFDVFSHITLTA